MFSCSFATPEKCFLALKIDFQARKSVWRDPQLDFQPRKTVFFDRKFIFDARKPFGALPNSIFNLRKLFSSLENPFPTAENCLARFPRRWQEKLNN